MYSSFSHYTAHKWDIPRRTTGSMISQETGKCMKYSIWKLQERGVIFIQPASEMYEGMVVGESAKPGDMSVNLTKNKQQTNVRESWNDEAMRLGTNCTYDIGRLSCLYWTRWICRNYSKKY
jgi:GTP-binding protein